jgi:hypothetical protein
MKDIASILSLRDFKKSTDSDPALPNLPEKVKIMMEEF